MGVRFDTEERKAVPPKTRVYSPGLVGKATPELEDASMPIRPQYENEAQKEPTSVRYRLNGRSKGILILAVFLVALTALISLFGSAEYARIIGEITEVEQDISDYEELMSQVRKSQSAMNDYSSINDVCVERGMTMAWIAGSDTGDVPASGSVPGTPQPENEP